MHEDVAAAAGRPPQREGAGRRGRRIIIIVVTIIGVVVPVCWCGSLRSNLSSVPKYALFESYTITADDEVS
jgi:hypothetical protein